MDIDQKIAKPSTAPPCDLAVSKTRLPRKRKDNTGKPPTEELRTTCIYRTPPPRPYDLYKRVPQSVTKCFKVVATFDNLLLVLVKYNWLDGETLALLASMNPEWEATIVNVPKLMRVDFTLLLEEELNWQLRTEISKETVRMMDAAAVYYNADFGCVLRWLGGKKLAAERNEDNCVGAVAAPYVSEEDLEHIRRILDPSQGCPAEFNWEEPAENKEAFIRQGNHPSVQQFWSLCVRTIVNEHQNNHVMIFSRWLARASPYAHHVPQSILTRKGNKPCKPRLIWDGSSKHFAHQWTMNEVTPTQREAQITFGYALMAFLIWIWNLRITFPEEEIFLAFVDISSCFRFPRVFADLVGAFGFILGPWYIAANAMVFGSVASASSWEPFRRAIQGIARARFYCEGLVEKYKDWIELVRWDKRPTEGVRLVQAKRCSKNKGIIDENGKELPTPHHIYVDDNLMADIGRRMPFTFAAALDAIFAVMGQPMPRLRQCAVALDKFKKLIVSHCLVLLGFLINTRDMTVGVTSEFRQEVLDLLEKTWHDGREAFDVKELEQLVGKLGRLGQAYRPIYHLMPHLYASIAYALRMNAYYLSTTSRHFRKMLKQIKMNATIEQDEREINFAVRKVAKMTHVADKRYRMPATMKEEIRIIKAILRDTSIRLETPIGHIVPRDPEFEAGADSCKSAGGGWSIDLLFWWHLVYPAEVIRRARLPNNKDGQYISINVLEMICVIINFAAVIYVCHVDGINLEDFPLLLNWCDNTSACSWINKKCKDSLIGRALGRLFLGLLMSTKLGIQAEWLPTELNKIADDISRLKGEGGDYDYSQLLTDHPSLRACRHFQPSDILLTKIWDVVLRNDVPDPLMIRELKPQALGSIISSDS